MYVHEIHRSITHKSKILEIARTIKGVSSSRGVSIYTVEERSLR